MTCCNLSDANPSLLGNNISKQPSFVLRNALYTLKTNETVTLNIHKCFQMGNMHCKHPEHLLVLPVKRHFFLLRCVVDPSKCTKVCEITRYNPPLLQNHPWLKLHGFPNAQVCFAAKLSLQILVSVFQLWREMHEAEDNNQGKGSLLGKQGWYLCLGTRQRFRGAPSQCCWAWTEVTALPWESDLSASKISHSSFSTIKKKKIRIVKCMPNHFCMPLKS